MAVATQLEILDLRHFSARQLRPLLEQEAIVWKQRLRWNYTSSTELLLQYLDTRSLPGFVALDRGRIRGFTFCVYEGNKAVLGDAFALGGDPPETYLVARILLEQILELLLHTPTVDRIESQLLLYDAGAIDDVFQSRGFVLYKRQFLELSLSKAAAIFPAPPSTVVLRRWIVEDYNSVAELIHDAYTGHIDAQINDQYRTVYGSLRFLHNIVRFPGCGVFDANSSWILRDGSTGALIGVAMCSDVGDKVAHLTQLCIAHAYRGQGIAGVLMRHCVANLAASGFKAITLTVTERNVEAMRLYRSLGFVVRHHFDAMVFEKPQR